jgi:membrane-bound metal-dependent hydrolase YbcI (DUF457 family)
MDPVSHAIFGATLVGMDGGRRFGGPARWMAAAGALTPDLDAVVTPLGWDRYLRIHEVWTHSILGAVASAIVAGLVASRLTRRVSLPVLITAALVGALSHVALDILSGATIRLLWPVSQARTAVPLVAMADPWLAGLLLIGLVARLSQKGRRPTIARWTVVTVTVLLAAKAVLLSRALTAYSAATAGRPALVALPDAEWGSLTAWFVSDRTTDHVRRWHVDVWTGRTALLLDVPRDADRPAARASLALESVRNVQRSHDFTFAVVDRSNSRVMWSDVRYCRPVRDKPRVICNLWFGGTLAPDGTPRSQRIVVGSYVKERP